MSLIWRDEDRVSRSDILLSVLVSNLAIPFQDVDLMLPVVAVKRSETTRVNREVTHYECRGSILLVDEPLDLDATRTFLSHG